MDSTLQQILTALYLAHQQIDAGRAGEQQRDQEIAQLNARVAELTAENDALRGKAS